MEWIQVVELPGLEPTACVVQVCKTRTGPCGVNVCAGEKTCICNWSVCKIN